MALHPRHTWLEQRFLLATKNCLAAQGLGRGFPHDPAHGIDDVRYDFAMATPIVVSGKNHTITHKSDGKKILMPFTSDAGNVIVVCDKL